MHTTYQPDVTDKFTNDFIRRTVDLLVAEGKVPARDRDDMIQDLRTELLTSLSNFNGDMGRWSTFVKTVINRRVKSLLRRQNSERNGGQETITSLNETIRDADDNPIDQALTIPEDARFPWLVPDRTSDIERTELEMDLETVFQKLSPEDRDLCERLKYQGVREIARELGICRSTLLGRLKKIRRLFERSGLRDYL